MSSHIVRELQAQLSTLVQPGRVLTLYGPRRVGKTTLVRGYAETFDGRVFYGVGDDMDLRRLLESEQLGSMLNALRGYDLVVIDEAQRVGNAGMALKMLVDALPQTRFIATGSSSFSLARKVGAPLTGRHKTVLMFPLWVRELRETFGGMSLHERFEELLVYGCYPESITALNAADKRDYLLGLRDSYLFKDILELDNVRNASKLQDLLALLAFQLGRDVSLSELGGALGVAKQTVERYLDLLEQAFVIRKVRGFSRNLRKEVSKSARYYFWDNGVRNAIVNNFAPLNRRNDIGMLWENFLFSERVKRNSYTRHPVSYHFWRTYDRKELDLVEESDGHLSGFEFKYSRPRKAIPHLWKDTYPEASAETISRENWEGFVM